MPLKSLFCIFSFILLYHLGFSQTRTLTDDDYNNSGAKKLTFVETTDCKQAEEFFKEDLKRNTVFLLLQGGIAPVIYDTDKDFQNNYGVYYYEFGCVGPETECTKKYNFLVFEYLRKTKGNKWLKDIRKDVLGLKDWRKNKNSL